MNEKSIILYAVIQCNLPDQRYVSNYTDSGEILIALYQREDAAMRRCELALNKFTRCVVKPITIY